MKLSILVPYKPDNGSRDAVWAYLKERYARLFPELELIVGLDPVEPFCKARAVNQAARKASGDVLVICDADVMFEPALIPRLKQALVEHSWIQPFDTCYKLTQETTRRVMANGCLEKVDGSLLEGEVIQFTDQAGPYLNVMTRECFEAVRGFDERFKAWGWQDVAFAYALDTICGSHHQLPGAIWHLWHASYADCTSAQFHQNEALWRRYTDAGSQSPAVLIKVIGQHQTEE